MSRKLYFSPRGLYGLPTKAMNLNLGKNRKEESPPEELNRVKRRGRNKQVALKTCGYPKWVPFKCVGGS